MRTVIFKIKGMHCSGCANKIQKLITEHIGVATVQVSFSEEKASILYDPKIVAQEQLVHILNGAGYDVTNSVE
ncbi:MAG: hypothetical protein BGO90_12275 [Legionella sp. 40-6]|nr:heavy-metal-associated domain-containing protein [Legionella sp.]OJY43981.1 MAG: hypothetical protein BGO90_12275 [Legionella sp. 40-6]